MKHLLTLALVALLIQHAHADGLVDDLVKAHDRAITAIQEAPRQVEAYKPKITGDITELATDAAEILKQLPFVK